jgi:hypothetical protein
MIFPARNLAGFALALFLGSMPLARAQAAQITVKATAKVSKALTFTSKQDLDFGTVMLAAGAGTSTVSISMTGVLTCPTGATCTGAARPAILNVAGANGQVVRIVTAPSDLVNAANGNTIRFTPVAPASVTLSNSGAPGKDFNVGGSIAVPSSSDGTYSGDIQVTVDYQ